VGTVIEDIVDQYLRKNQEKFGMKLDRVTSYEDNVHKLMKGRFDLLGMNKDVSFYLLGKLGYSRNDVKIVYVLNELKNDYYLVASKAVPAEIVKKLRAAFEKIHGNGTYQKIVDEYFKGMEGKSRQ